MQKEDYVTTSDGQDALISREGLAVSRSQWALTAASVVSSYLLGAFWVPARVPNTGEAAVNDRKTFLLTWDLYSSWYTYDREIKQYRYCVRWRWEHVEKLKAGQGARECWGGWTAVLYRMVREARWEDLWAEVADAPPWGLWLSNSPSFQYYLRKVGASLCAFTHASTGRQRRGKYSHSLFCHYNSTPSIMIILNAQNTPLRRWTII